jgi:uncharacterized membrane protein
MTEDPDRKTPEQIAHDLLQGAIKKKETGHLGRLRRYFFAGLLVLTPLVLTIWIVGWLINLIDGNMRSFLGNLLQNLGLEYQITVFGRQYEVIPIGFGLLLVFLLTCFVGMVASNLVGRRIINLIDRLIRRVPGVSWIYKATHQVSHALLSRNKDLFHQVIFVEYPRRGLYSIAFVTNLSVPGLKLENGEELRSVFLPTTPNPTSGYLLLVPESECVPCPMTVEESMKMIISGGVVLPESLTCEMTYLPLLNEVRPVGP